jgi:cysteine desulfurase
MCGDASLGSTWLPNSTAAGKNGGLRSGTLYPPQIVGFQQAVAVAIAEMEPEQRQLQQLRDRLWQALADLPGVHLNGHPSQRLAGNLNLSVEGVDGQALLLGLRHVVAVSSGSACSTSSTAPLPCLDGTGGAVMPLPMPPCDLGWGDLPPQRRLTR